MKQNTRIDFHSNVQQPLDYACRLIRKALAAQCRLVVYHQDEHQLAQLDRLLWTFSATDFLPHVVLKSADQAITERTPVWLTLAPEEVAGVVQPNTILLNLSERVPANFTQFERLIEIVPQSTSATQAGRERYRFYQQQGYQLNHINAK
jgi:DNA polymerase III subunit chi